MRVAFRREWHTTAANAWSIAASVRVVYVRSEIWRGHDAATLCCRRERDLLSQPPVAYLSLLMVR